MLGLAGAISKEFRIYPKCNRKLLGDFKQGSDMIRFMFSELILDKKWRMDKS